ncbi:beta-galactosidase-1-like protein 2 [Lycaon pictus]
MRRAPHSSRAAGSWAAGAVQVVQKPGDHVQNPAIQGGHLHPPGLTHLPPPPGRRQCLTCALSSPPSMLTLLRPVGILYLSSGLLVLAQFRGHFSPRMNQIFLTPSRMINRGVGLKVEGSSFTLDGSPFLIIAGTIHYFRVPREYWRDRLQKLKACGFNTVTTHIPWNLHEPRKGWFYFTANLDFVTFVAMASEAGLWVILCPGPYVGGDLDLGGLPSWLLRDPKMKLRTTYKGFTKAVNHYFDKIIPMIVQLQYAKGGPIIAVQVENEYGSYHQDKRYLKYIKKALVTRGIKVLLMTGDDGEALTRGHLTQGTTSLFSVSCTEEREGPGGGPGSVGPLPSGARAGPGMIPLPSTALSTVHMRHIKKETYDTLFSLQSKTALRFREEYKGMGIQPSDDWAKIRKQYKAASPTGQSRAYIVKGEQKHEVDEKLDVSTLDQNEHIVLSGSLVPVLKKEVREMFNASFSLNFYMFHGGTNFGFMGGSASLDNYLPMITSYDYGALLTENGEYTPEYFSYQDFFSFSLGIPKHPQPDSIPKATYKSVITPYYISLWDVMPYLEEPISSVKPICMEKLSVNQGSGQSSGYVLYETMIISGGLLTTKGHLQDRGQATEVCSRSRGATGYPRSPWELVEFFKGDRAELRKCLCGLQHPCVHTSPSSGLSSHLILNPPLRCADGGEASEKGNASLRVFVDDIYIGILDHSTNHLTIPTKMVYKNNPTLRILVENQGRLAYGQNINKERKGLIGDIYLNNSPLRKFKIYSLDMKTKFLRRDLPNIWKPVVFKHQGPAFFLGILRMGNYPRDTFIKMEGWTKGVIFINGQNLGRYWNIGPQETLYLPGPWLHPGSNEIIVFEEFKPGLQIHFTNMSHLGY